ncbi:MAG: LysM peptidoglycan-binding domain-containing protein [Bacteroidetes bacterium]|nr:LysM peptidoglycan-binding domain-containing protein [Bacteroidota bacterium]
MNRTILTILFLSLSLFIKAQDKDGICEVELKGTEYALHLVELGDNLFRISQKYNSTVEDIWNENPSLVDNNIIPGQVIKVPKNSRDKAKEVVANNNSGIKSDNKPKAEAVKLDPAQLVYHEVGPKQTLFSISRMYDVSIADIQKWNNLPDYSISVGQKLIVSAHGELKVFDEEDHEVISYQPSNVPIKSTVSVNARQDVLYQKYDAERAYGKSLSKERGTAGKLVTGNPNAQDAYYALHKTAPVGSIVKVVNLVNRRSVFVKVLAPLPDIKENENIQIKLSPAATTDLILLDEKSLVEISFYK